MLKSTSNTSQPAATLSRAVARIRPSVANAASKRANELAKSGRDIINLTTGEPDFSTPTYVIDAAIEAMHAGHTKYTAVDGSDDLKQAIIEKLFRENNLRYIPTEIIASAGAKQILFNALLALLNHGDETIIVTPSWLSYREMVLFTGGVPIAVRADVPFDTFLKNLEDAISPKTKVVMINSPNNPTGRVFSESELRQLAQILMRHPTVILISDEIYEHINFTGDRIKSIVEVAPELREQTLIVNGVSKAYSMTGWRLGYGAGPEFLITAMAKIQSQSTSCPSSISQAAAAAALRSPQNIVRERSDEFLRRRNFLLEEFMDMPGIIANKPDGAFYLLMDCKELLGALSKKRNEQVDDSDLVDTLLNDAGLAFVQGSPFDAPSYIRMSFAASESQLEKACLRLRDFCRSIMSNGS